MVNQETCSRVLAFTFCMMIAGTCFGFAIGLKWGEAIGYKDGRYVGYESGYDAGCDRGWEVGIERGYIAGSSVAYMHGYLDGRTGDFKGETFSIPAADVLDEITSGVVTDALDNYVETSVRSVFGDTQEEQELLDELFEAVEKRQK